MKNFRRLIAVLIAAAGAPVALSAQEAATVTGRVTNAQGQPEAAVLVRIESLNVGASTGADGNYRLVIPSARIRAGQSVTITASRTGLSPVSRTVTLSPGAELSQNFQMATSVLLLEDVVVTGTAGAVEARKVPFEVGQVTAEDIQVPPSSAAGAIQGKVAGATVVQGSGRPGSAPSILLRGPKSINAAGRSQEPLYIVDGVILGSGMQDVDALDIEKIEVLKGAAAASLYGSRAANGVVQITTRRGNRVADDQVRYSFRTEYGRSALPRTPEALLAEAHQYRDTVINGQQYFINNSGGICRFSQCANLAPAGQRRGTGAAGPNNTFLEKPYLGQSYDQVDAFFRDGVASTNYFSAEGRAGATNFHVSFNNQQDEGIVPGLEGLNRNNFRVNVDQAIRSNVSVSASAFYSRSTNDQLPEGGGNPLFDLTRTPAGVNIWACEGDTLDTSDCRDRPEDIRLQINPINTESENPAYSLTNRQYNTERGRFLGSANFRYSPVSWFDVDANASYDRLDRRDTDLYPDGFRTLTASPGVNNGRLFRYNEASEAFNGSVTGTFRFDLTDNIHNRTQFRYLYEETDLDATNTSGYEFVVGDVESFANVNAENLAAASTFEPVRADGYFAITNFDIADRYVIDALVRNDGSSLFGRDERRQWYYRLAAAWLLSEESWFNLPVVDDLKLRYSIGTAGGRPAFAAQYETFTITSGSVSPLTLGNNALKPEFTTEHEAGFDLGFLNNRATLTVNYANSVTEDQILPLPLPAYTGYTTRTINAGTLESNTWELSLDTRLIDRGNFGWNARVNFDRTRSEITAMNVPGYRYGGATSQGLATTFYAREGEELGTFYGLQFARSCDDLPAAVASLPGGIGACDKFRVNDEGMLVWTNGEELSAAKWGTTAPLALQTAHPRLGGLAFGLPFGGLCNDRVSGEQTDYCPLGRTLPDYTLSFSSTMSYGGLSLYGLIDAVQGFDVYNQPLQWATFASISGIMDQSGVEESLKKPLAYYNQLYGASGLRPSSAFVEDGSFVKFRELSLRYTFGESLLGRLPGINNFDGLSVFVTGRNLKTWTDYRGFDPEVGSAGAQTGSAALGRVEGYQYPNFRTWTLGAEVNF